MKINMPAIDVLQFQLVSIMKCDLNYHQIRVSVPVACSIIVKISFRYNVFLYIFQYLFF